MERIGITASKIAKGNLFLYNVTVILLISLFSFLVFLICSAAFFIILIIIEYLNKIQTMPEIYQGWIPVMMTCLVSIAVGVGIFALSALIQNIKLKKSK